MNPRSITLAVETAIGNGSLSLLRGQTVIGELQHVSRAEELLVRIERLLFDCEVSRNDIDMIAVSLGPGSFTGIRIGLATALGLRSSLGARCFGVSAFDALSVKYPDKDVVIAIPIGRGQVALQEFSSGRACNTPRVVEEQELGSKIENRNKLIRYDSSDFEFAGSRTEPLSTLIGRGVFSGRGSEELKPLYLRPRFTS